MTGKRPASLASNDGVVTLTYIGTVYGSTDPGTFVAAVLGLPEAVRSRLKVRFIGHIETPAYRETLESLGETIELRGFVPQAEALRAIGDTTYLLLITHDRINVAGEAIRLSGRRQADRGGSASGWRRTSSTGGDPGWLVGRYR